MLKSFNLYIKISINYPIWVSPSYSSQDPDRNDHILILGNHDHIFMLGNNDHIVILG